MKRSFRIRPRFFWDGAKKHGVPDPHSMTLIILTDGERSFSSVRDMREALDGHGFIWTIVNDGPDVRIEVKCDIRDMTFDQLFFLGQVGATLNLAEREILSVMNQANQEYVTSDDGSRMNLLDKFLDIHGGIHIRPVSLDLGRPGGPEPALFLKF